MIESYTLTKDESGQVLVLYLNYNYEFGVFGKGNTVSNMKENIRKYIEKMKIDFKGGKVLLVVGGISLATIFLPMNETTVGLNEDIHYVSSEVVENITSNTTVNSENILESTETEIQQEEAIEEEHKEESVHNEVVSETPVFSGNTNIESNYQNNVDTSNAHNSTTSKEISEPIVEEVTYKNPITIYRSTGAVTMEFEDYIVGVVAAEMPASFNMEALKAQAVVARTYAKKVLSRGGTLTDTVSTQAYKDENGMRAMWGSSFATYYNKIKQAVNATEGVSIYYAGDYIDAVYHSTSNGYTEDAIYVWGNDVPYLKRVDSTWDIGTSSYLKTEEKSSILLWNTLGLSVDSNTDIELTKDESGRVREVKIGENIYNGVTFRQLLNLRSTDFDLEIQNGALIVTTRGYGHGVGMSQYGANEMAKQGYSYIDILKHYYTGVSVY